MQTEPRRRVAARTFTLTVALLLLALAPLSASARAAAPVVSASSASGYYSGAGTTCADVETFYFQDFYSALITFDPALFGIPGYTPESITANGSFIATAMGQRVFYIHVSATVLTGDVIVSSEWSGYAALKCLSGGAMQFSFKPDFDDYFVFPAFVQAAAVACGDLGGNARLIATVNPTTGAFGFNVYAPMTVNPHDLSECQSAG
jgi:hypothetical protein